MDIIGQRPRDLHLDDWKLLQRAVSEFEQGWQLDDTDLFSNVGLPKEHHLYKRLLIELIKVDQEFALDHGQYRSLEEYLTSWPEVKQDQATLLELLESECLTRNTAGQWPTRSELKSRFPELAEQVRLEDLADQAQLDTQILGETTVGTGHSPGTSPLKETPQFTPGDKFGRYQIRGQVGEGSMGTVYRAIDTRLKRDVALKILQFNETDLVKRFSREAQAAAQLHHRNICPVFDVGKIGDMHFIAMAFIDGPTLADQCRQGIQSISTTVEQTRKLAIALHHMHQHGIIHRDIKPSNVLIDADEEPLLTDFGLALLGTPPYMSPEHQTVADLVQSSRDATQQHLSETGALLGTPAYMSPEQINGDATDLRTDVYSLGVVFYQLLTGRLPFRGSLGTVLADIIHTPPTAPTSINPQIPIRLERVCLKSLAKLPEDRFQSAAEMAAAIDAASKPSARPAGKSPSRKWVSMIALLGLLLGGIIFAKTGSGQLELDVDGHEVTVLVDGKKVTLKGNKIEVPLSVGTHRVEVIDSNSASKVKSVTIHWRGSTAVIKFEFDSAPSGQSRPRVIEQPPTTGTRPQSKAGFAEDFDGFPDMDIFSYLGSGQQAWKVDAKNPEVFLSTSSSIRVGESGKSLHFRDDSEILHCQISRKFSPLTKVELDYYMRSDATDREAAFVTLQGDGGEDYTMAFGNEDGGGNADWIGILGLGGWEIKEFLPYRRGRWYHVHRSLDVRSGKGTFYVAEVDPNTGEDIQNRSRTIKLGPMQKHTYLDRLGIWTSGSQMADSYIDEISVGGRKR